MSKYNIIKLDAISSTNDYLKKKYKSNSCKDGDIIWTKEQTHGKGQREKKWISQKGKSLTISVYKEFDKFKVSNSFVLTSFKMFRIYLCVSLIIPTEAVIPVPIARTGS